MEMTPLRAASLGMISANKDSETASILHAYWFDDKAGIMSASHVWREQLIIRLVTDECLAHHVSDTRPGETIASQ